DQLHKLWPELEIVALARNGDEAAAQVAELQPDIAFLDIQMPGLTGLDVAAGIEGATRVVFVTAYDEYAIEAFEAEALDYVLKPVTAERLGRTVERLRRAFGPQAAATPEPDAHLARALRALQAPAPAAAPLRWIRASQGELTHQVDVADVLFFQSDDKYTCVRTATAEYLIRTPVTELAAQLDAQQFWQVHRSTIVNLAHLAGTRRDDASRLFVRIKGWTGELPVSRAYVHLFKPM
ncbi:MAG TPA: LytTR family DNA-binding domain-containing protein, partial [Burkholderiaceae bacterium]